MTSNAEAHPDRQPVACSLGRLPRMKKKDDTFQQESGVSRGSGVRTSADETEKRSTLIV